MDNNLKGRMIHVLLFIAVFHITIQIPQSDQIITEFTENPLTTFTGWTFSNGQAATSMVCGTLLPVFGEFGNNNQIWKTYDTSNPHYSSIVSFDILKLDYWDNDHLDILVDGVLARSLNKFDFETVQLLCRTNTDINWGDQLKTFNSIVPHSSQTLVLKFCGFFDELISKEAWGVRNIVITLKLCDSTCHSCTGPASNQCTSCISPYFQSSTTCVIDCGVGNYGDTNDRTCKPCGANNCLPSPSVTSCQICSYVCEECYDSDPDQCTKCPGNQLLFDRKSVGGTYYDKCIDKKYLNMPHPDYGNLGFYLQDGNTDINSGRAVALLCLPPCLTCSGKFICSTCLQGMYLYDGTTSITCINCKAKGLFVKGSNCLRCPSGCDICLNEGYCEQCHSGTYLEYSGSTKGFTGQCKTCKDLLLEYVDDKFSATDGSGVCLNQAECAVAISNCKVCSNKLKECSSCKDNYYLKKINEPGQDYCSICLPDYFLKINPYSNEMNCQKRTLFFGNLSSTSDPQVFRLLFNDTWEEFFENFSQKFKIELPNFQTNDSECKAQQDVSSSNLFVFNCTFMKNISQGDSLKVTLLNFPIETEKTPFMVETREYFLALDSFVVCPENLTYNKACEPKSTVSINFELRKIIDPLKCDIIFNKDLPDFFESSLQNSIKIQSDSFEANFTLNKKNEKLYEIEFYFENVVTNHPDYSVEITSNDSRVKFPNAKQSTSLSDFYKLTDEEKSTVANVGQTGRLGSQAAEVVKSLNIIFMPGSIFALKGLVLIQTFQLMRYIEIDYPPNVIELFEGKLLSFVQDFDIDVESDDGILDGHFYKFSYSKYILNNSGSYIIAGFCYFLLGLLGYYIVYPCKVKYGKSRYFLKLIQLFENTFRWNIVISHILSFYMTLVFTVLSNMRFPTLYSHIGRFNLVFSIISSAFVFFVPVFIFKQFYYIKKLKRKVMPIIDKNSTEEQKEVEIPIKTHEQNESQLLSLPEKQPRTSLRQLIGTPILTTNAGDLELKYKDKFEQELKGETIRNNMDSTISGIYLDQDRKPFRFSKVTDSVIGDYRPSIQIDNGTSLTEPQLLIKTNEKSPEKHIYSEAERNLIKEKIEIIEESYKAIHEDFNQDNWFGSHFILFELLRQILITFLILFLCKNAIELLIIIIVINGIFFILTFRFNPFKRRQVFILNALSEVFLIITSLGALVLAFLQNNRIPTRPEDLQTFLNIGWMIVYSYIVLVCFFLCIQTINYVIMVRDFVKKIQQFTRKYIENRRRSSNKHQIQLF